MPTSTRLNLSGKVNTNLGKSGVRKRYKQWTFIIEGISTTHKNKYKCLLMLVRKPIKYEPTKKNILPTYNYELNNQSWVCRITGIAEIVSERT